MSEQYEIQTLNPVLFKTDNVAVYSSPGGPAVTRSGPSIEAIKDLAREIARLKDQLHLTEAKCDKLTAALREIVRTCKMPAVYSPSCCNYAKDEVAVFATKALEELSDD